LVAAINQANSDSDLDVICLSSGAYAMNVVQMMNTGLPLITTPIEIQGNGAALIRAAGSPAFRIFNVVAGGQLVLDSVSITGGQISGADGGAIFNMAGTVEVVDSLITGNSARSGGAIYNDNGSVTITNTDILSNSAAAASGGGILNIGTGSVLTITDSAVNDNNASTGGGIYNANGRVTVTSSTISGNSATTAAGFFNDDFGIVTMNQSVLSGNTSVVFGGAVAAEGATIQINNSCITNNVSPLGSGIVNLNTPPINAEMDWWGAANGPGGEGGGSGDAVSGNVDFTPFLTTPPAFCPAAQPAAMTLLHAILGE
jgi:predicted outer membrane repeat protein